MRAGEHGRIAILWAQTEIDGLEAAPQSFLNVGAAWSWRGQAWFLDETAEQSQVQTGGAQTSTTTLNYSNRASAFPDNASGQIVLTNGAQQFAAALFVVEGDSSLILVFEKDCPARDQDYWISEVTEFESQSGEVANADDTVVAFPSVSRVTQRPDVQHLRSVVSAGRVAD